MGFQQIQFARTVAKGTVVTGVFAKDAPANAGTRPILLFPCASVSGYRGRRKALLLTLRASSGTPIILNLSSCHTLNQEDIALLLKCMARVTGRDTPLLLVASSHIIRILLEVTRIASLVLVFSSIEDAQAFPWRRAQDG
jgi:anti-anti-sigma regulatory factor